MAVGRHQSNRRGSPCLPASQTAALTRMRFASLDQKGTFGILMCGFGSFSFLTFLSSLAANEKRVRKELAVVRNRSVEPDEKEGGGSTAETAVLGPDAYPFSESFSRKGRNKKFIPWKPWLLA